jgi:hypothetical protein
MNEKSEKLVTLNRFGRALVWTTIGVGVGILELILFSWTAHFFGVVIELAKMQTNWLVAFYTLFVIPGVCFFFAFVTIFG